MSIAESEIDKVLSGFAEEHRDCFYSFLRSDFGKNENYFHEGASIKRRFRNKNQLKPLRIDYFLLCRNSSNIRLIERINKSLILALIINII